MKLERPVLEDISLTMPRRSHPVVLKHGYLSLLGSWTTGVLPSWVVVGVNQVNLSYGNGMPNLVATDSSMEIADVQKIEPCSSG